MDRHIDYTKLIEYLNTGVVRNLICMPTTGYMIADKIYLLSTDNLFFINPKTFNY